VTKGDATGAGYICRKLRFFIRLLLGVAAAIAALSYPLYACECVPPLPGETPKEAFERQAKESPAIFEGIVENIRLDGPLISASKGAVVGANIDDESPFLLVSFRVGRTYRGAHADHIELRTGLGGGDCGFGFQVGKKYLVVAYKDDKGNLSTGICTETGLLSERGADVAYLRGERVPKASPQGETIASGKVCGHVFRSATNEATDEIVALYGDGEFSPVPDAQADVNGDGSFCVEDVEPGSYRIFYGRERDDGPAAFGFFPGVLNASTATVIHIAPGQILSGLDFTIPIQETYEVEGAVNQFTATKMQAAPEATLLRVDGPQFLMGYSKRVSKDGSFIFRNVLPGKYWALVTVESDDDKWLTREVAVDVHGTIADLNLDFFRK
jgi:hypothetical protein